MSNLKEVNIHVSGKVQGVFFREFVKETAEALALTGQVRNVPDGSVEIVAQGAETSLKKFIVSIKKDSPHARVLEVNVAWKEMGEKRVGFSIVQ